MIDNYYVAFFDLYFSHEDEDGINAISKRGVPYAHQLFKNRLMKGSRQHVGPNNCSSITSLPAGFTKECGKIVEQVESHITFLGSIPHEEVMQRYCQFSHHIETYGLPLKEASLCGAPIIAADRPFSKEILENYPNKLFFSAMDSHMLAKQMELLFDKKSKAEVRL